MNHPYANGSPNASNSVAPMAHPSGKAQPPAPPQHMNGGHGDVYGTTTGMTAAPAARHDGQPTFVDPVPRALPKIGETRCYWSLLSAGLDFIYLDPVLQYHLEEQASTLVGRSLLDFVHPDERSSAQYDLGSVLDNKTLHGSVTRVRYSRLSRIRYDLGHRTSQSPWQEADRIALDDHYMAVDIVINWAADNLVLCFIHAVTDLGPEDNDEQHKSHWTNWCGTPYMSMQQIELLYQRLLVCVPLNSGVVSTRVFQIMSNDNKALMMTWPPDQGQGRDYAKLVEDVNIHSGQGGDGAKTSCTRRYKACQLNHIGEIESIIVPHGTIIFACHKQQQQQQQYYDQNGNGYPTPPPYASTVPAYGNGYQHPQGQPGYPAQQWADPNSEAPYAQHQQWNNNQQQYMDSSQAYPPRPEVAPETAEYGYNAGPASATASDLVPPSRRRASPQNSNVGTAKDSASASSKGRAPVPMPAGVQRCTSCKTTQSPEWRKGPSGKKELCNACGLRFARSRAKKEGTGSAANRKRKEKSGASLSVSTKNGGNVKAESGSLSPSSERPARRQRLEDASQSGGSASGEEQKPKVTPSPSPSESFVHYAHPNGAHQRNAHLDPASSYAHAAGNMPPASYRASSGAGTSYERDRDLPMPPTPVSPDGRMSSARSMLMLQQ
ncbi:hypothetical protein HWV62_41008 [Athelia sp. TMB]|nr:hypothetical protein HWV62_41008 [Athelia sp. TMB]